MATFAYDEAGDTLYLVEHRIVLDDSLILEVSIDRVKTCTRRDVAERVGVEGRREDEWIVTEIEWRAPRPLIPWKAPLQQYCSMRGACGAASFV